MAVPETSHEDVPTLVRAIAERHRGSRGPLLPVLHDVQDRIGFIDDAAVRAVAEELNLSRAEVAGVVSFYSDFRAEPAGRTTVRLCRAEACRSVGAQRVVDEVEQALGIKVGNTSPDGAVTLDQVFCLGNCALGPAAQVDGHLYGRVDAATVLGLIAAERG